MQSYDFMKYRILTCMWEDDALHCKVSVIARTLGEEKYTISRAMMRMEQEGLVDRTNKFTPRLTPEGIRAAEWFLERYRICFQHLLYKEMSDENARKDAMLCAVCCSDEMISIMGSNDGFCHTKSNLSDLTHFNGKMLCENMQDGNYRVPFLFNRDKIKNNGNISMANSGFSHPCVLHVKDGKGMVELHIIPMHERSGQNGMDMEGRVSSFAYYGEEGFCDAAFQEDRIFFPADFLEFINVGEILYGSLYVKLQCSVGPVHMPESKAIFTVFI